MSVDNKRVLAALLAALWVSSLIALFLYFGFSVRGIAGSLEIFFIGMPLLIIITYIRDLLDPLSRVLLRSVVASVFIACFAVVSAFLLKVLSLSMKALETNGRMLEFLTHNSAGQSDPNLHGLLVAAMFGLGFSGGTVLAARSRFGRLRTFRLDGLLGSVVGSIDQLARSLAGATALGCLALFLVVVNDVNATDLDFLGSNTVMILATAAYIAGLVCIIINWGVYIPIRFVGVGWMLWRNVTR